MLALRKLAAGNPQLALTEVPEPQLRPGHVVLDVAAAGICGTDVHIMHDEYRSEPLVTLGHEICGTVAALGDDPSVAEVPMQPTPSRGDRAVAIPSR